jgi:hypothetical protein
MPTLRSPGMNATVEYRLLERVLDQLQQDERSDRFADRLLAALDRRDQHRRIKSATQPPARQH